MFLNEGHKKDNNVSMRQSAKNNVARIDTVEGEGNFVFMIQKAEKLTTAIYLITDFLDVKESFRWKIRDVALSFMSILNNLKNTAPVFEKEYVVKQAISSLSQIISLLELAISIRFISQMNYSILKGEYRDLYDILYAELRTDKPKDNLFFPQSFFEVPSTNKGHFIKDTHKGQNKLKNVLDDEETSSSGENHNKLQDPSTKIEEIEEIKEKDNDSIISNKKSERQQAVLMFLRSRGSANIKDIAGVVSGCSEKTIQRELMSLIKNGIIRRIGERRWSKYALTAQSV